MLLSIANVRYGTVMQASSNFFFFWALLGLEVPVRRLRFALCGWVGFLAASVCIYESLLPSTKTRTKCTGRPPEIFSMCLWWFDHFNKVKKCEFVLSFSHDITVPRGSAKSDINCISLFPQALAIQDCSYEWNIKVLIMSHKIVLLFQSCEYSRSLTSSGMCALMQDISIPPNPVPPHIFLHDCDGCGYYRRCNVCKLFLVL